MSEGRFKPWDLERFTIPMLLCLANKNPPGGGAIESFAQMQAFLEERKNAETAWSAEP